MATNIVIAYYNNENYIDLLNKFDNLEYKYKAIIYNKSSKDIKIENEKWSTQKLNNIGREGETYLNHIIQNYDKFSEYTIFIQDDTNNHITNYDKFFIFCQEVVDTKSKFKLYPCSWRDDGYVHMRTIYNGIYNLHTFPSNDAIKQCCEYNNIYLPQQYTTETCAFFICHKDSILKHEKDFYIKLRDWLLNDERNGFVLEHVWKLIFN
jgi:hypothetical protein